MKVRLKTSISGPSGAFAPNDVVDLPEDEAHRFIERDLAEAVAATAPAAQPEHHAPKKPRKSKKD